MPDFDVDVSLAAQVAVLAGHPLVHRRDHEDRRRLADIEATILARVPGCRVSADQAYREADLAMTELFGGFGSAFYAAYREAWPLAPGYPVRKTLYNLYHILNHANMFGGGYAGQAVGMMQRLLAELG
mgnify:CR=1 FL=1